MRKKILAGLTILGTLTLLTLTMTFAGKNGQAGKSNIGHLYLYEKHDGVIVPGGAWGKMKYNLAGSTFDFVFNGHGLEPEKAYSLIYYADPWPGNNPGALIASGMTNDLGDIHLRGSPDLEMDLPHSDDANYPDGAKIWLVLSADYNGVRMTGWHETEYLFESDLISFDDTD